MTTVQNITLTGNYRVPRYLDLGLAPNGVDLTDTKYVVTASNGSDTIFLRPAGYIFEFIEGPDSATDPDYVDTICLTGNYANYTKSLIEDDTDSGVYWLELTRGSDDTAETIRLKTTATSEFLFADGSISVSDIVTATDMTSVTLDTDETSGSINVVGQVRMVSGDGSAQTFVASGTTSEIVLAGSAQVDSVYIGDASVVDATGLSLGKDNIYLPASWGDYTKEIDGTNIIFSRTVTDISGTSRLEQITVAANLGASNDHLVFADGAIDSRPARLKLLSVGLDADSDDLGADWDNSETSQNTVLGGLELELLQDTGSVTDDQITNNGTFKVTGLEGGLKWQYSTDGGASWTTVSNGISTFDAPPQDSGGAGVTYEKGDIQVRQVSPFNVAGAASSNDKEYTIDGAAEGLTLNVGEGSKLLQVNRISGTAEPGAAIEVSVPGGFTGTGTADADGNYSIDYFFSGVNRDYTVTVKQTDISGNISSIDVDVTVYAEPDPVTGIELVEDTGVSDTDGITNAATVKVLGIWPGMNWQYSLKGSAWTNGTGDSFDLPGQSSGEGGITYGAGDIRVRQISTSGNSGDAYSNIDAITVDVLASAPTTQVDDGDVVLAVHHFKGFAQAGANLSIEGAGFITSGMADASTGEYDVTVAFVQNGNQTVKITQTDTAGNKGVTTRTVNVEGLLDAPTGLSLTTDTGASSTDFVTSNGAMEVAGLWDGYDWEYSLDGGRNWTAGSGDGFTLPGAAGVGNIYAAGDILVHMLDSSGNDGENIKNTSEIRVDTGIADPVPDDISVVLLDHTFTGTGEPGAAIKISWNDGTNHTVEGVVDGDGNYELDVTFANTGSQSLTVTQTDLAGHSASKTINVTAQVLPAAPTAIVLVSDTGSSSVDGVTSNGTVRVEGLTAGLAWEYSVNGGTDWLSGSGSTFELPSDGSDGTTYQAGDIMARQVNSLGNPGESNALSSAVTVDKVVDAPTVDDVDGIKLTHTFSGKAESGATVTISWGTTDSKTVIADAQGDYSVDVTFASTARQEVSVTQVDVSGNVSSAKEVIVNNALAISSAVNGVTNLDVRSDIVLTSTESLELTSTDGTYYVTLKDLASSTGYGRDAGGGAVNNTQRLEIVVSGGEVTKTTWFENQASFASSNGVAISDISSVLTFNGTILTLNPYDDLDLSSNYELTVDNGLLVGTGSGLSTTFSATFSTVSPASNGANASGATQAGMMKSDGTIETGSSWLDLTGVGNAFDASPISTDASAGKLVYVFQDSNAAGATASDDGVSIYKDLNVLINNFNLDDLIYVDNLTNTSNNDMSLSTFPQGNGSSGDPLTWFQVSTDGNAPIGSFAVVLASDLGSVTNGALDSVVSELGFTNGMVISA